MARRGSQAPGVLRALRGLGRGVRSGLQTKQDISVQERQIAMRQALTSISEQRETREQEKFELEKAGIPQREEQSKIQGLADLVGSLLPASFLSKLEPEDRVGFILLRAGIEGSRDLGQANELFDDVVERLGTVAPPVDEREERMDQIREDLLRGRLELQNIELEEKRGGEEEEEGELSKSFTSGLSLTEERAILSPERARTKPGTFGTQAEPESSPAFISQALNNAINQHSSGRGLSIRSTVLERWVAASEDAKTLRQQNAFSPDQMRSVLGYMGEVIDEVLESGGRVTFPGLEEVFAAGIVRFVEAGGR